MPIAINHNQLPEFTAKKWSLSDPELESKINGFLNSSHWIDHVLSHEDSVLFIFAKFKEDEFPMETIN